MTPVPILFGGAFLGIAGPAAALESYGFWLVVGVAVFGILASVKTIESRRPAIVHLDPQPQLQPARECGVKAGCACRTLRLATLCFVCGTALRGKRHTKVRATADTSEVSGKKPSL